MRDDVPDLATGAKYSALITRLREEVNGPKDGGRIWEIVAHLPFFV